YTTLFRAGGVNASAAEALGPRLFGRVHVRTGLTAGGRPLPDNVGAENPLILKRSVHGDGFFVIFSQINLLLLKFGFSASAGEAQEQIGRASCRERVWIWVVGEV